MQQNIPEDIYLDSLTSKTVIGTDANGKIIDTTATIAGIYVPYTGATGNVTLGAFTLTSAGYLITSETHTDGKFLRCDGTNAKLSTLILPNAATTGQVVHATATNTWGGGTYLTCSTAGLLTVVGTTSTTGLAVTGRITLTGVTAPNNTAGTGFTGTAGNGGPSTSGNGRKGGQFTFTCGAGSVAFGATSNCGAGGDFNVTTGAGAIPTASGQYAGKGGDFIITLGNAGNVDIGANGNSGGSFIINDSGIGGAGSSCSGDGFYGGEGGYIKMYSGIGGPVFRTGATDGNEVFAGAGGTFVFTPGIGGNASSNRADLVYGGNGGGLTFEGADGGIASGGETSTGGTGSTLQFYGGNGGGTTSTATVANIGGDGGDIYIAPGFGTTPSGAGAVRGLDGAVIMCNNGGISAGGVAIGYLTTGAGVLLDRPTARLHIVAGTATAGTAPLKFETGTLLTTAEAGVMEFASSRLYFSVADSARKEIVLNDGTNLTSGRVPFCTTNGRLTDDSDMTFSGSRLTVTDLTSTNAPIISSLTAGRVVFAGSSKELVGDSDMTFSTDTLTVTKIASSNFKANSGTTTLYDDFIYGHMYGDDVSITITVSSASVYYAMGAGLSSGTLNGITHANSVFTVATAGVYKVDWSATATCATANQNISIAVMTKASGGSDTAQHSTEGSTKLTTAGDAKCVAGTGILTLGANAEVKFCVENETGANNITITHATMTLLRIDN